MKFAKFYFMGVVALAFSMVAANAQSQTGLNFSVGTDAVAAHYHGNWYAGTVINQKLDVKDSKSDANGYVDSLYVLGEQKLLGPTAGFNYYGGGFEVVPTKTLASFLKFTNIPADSFRVFARGTVGNTVPTVGNAYLTGSADAGLRMAITRSGSVVWNTVEAGWQNPGIFYVTSGLQAFWGGSTVNSQSKASVLIRKAKYAVSHK